MASGQAVGAVPTGLGRLDQVDPRAVWPHEAHDFTPWLLDNADRLGEALGMDLALHQAEHPVGGFSLDLLGVDEATGETVIVENQLGQSDHSHLGQILTYAGGVDAVNVVWVALGFRDEHRAALEWLNARTSERTRFFAVQVSVVRIGDSAPAPLLEAVVKPNDWGKAVGSASTAVSEKGEAYREFWAGWLERVRSEHPEWTNARKPQPAQWMAMSTGLSGVSYNVSFTRAGLCCEIYFGAASSEVNEHRFRAAEARKPELDAAFGRPLTWDALPGRKGCRISAMTPGSVEQADQWPAYLDWFIETHGRLRQAVELVGGVEELVSD